MINIHTVGGFDEVGKNMVVLEIDEDAFIFDEGFFLPAVISMQERDHAMTEKKMKNIGAIPDDSVIDKIKHKVRAQFIGHAHLDHVGGFPYMSDKYDAPIYGTPFTIEILDSLLQDSDTVLKNKVVKVQPNSSFYVEGKSGRYLVDFINITHSTIQTAMIAVHTPKGVVVYANDFKIDDSPTHGLKPNYKRLRELAKEGVYALIVDSLYAPSDKKTPSEKIARNLLEEVLLTIQNRHAGIIVTTFSSHIARLKSIVEFAKKIDREVVFLGRSLNKYSNGAIRANAAPFLRDVHISKYRRQVEKTLHKAEKNRRKYLVVCTGHQGEPGSILERISRNQIPYKVSKDDNIVFSSSVIPTPENREQFAKMEPRLRKNKARIFRDVHVSGHGGKEDIRDMINILQPQHIIPSHGGHDKTEATIDLATELGYSKNQKHLMSNGNILRL